MSELEPNVKVIAEKVWGELAKADPNLHPWAEAEEPERMELGFVVALVLQFAAEDLKAQVMQLGPEGSEAIDEFPDEPVAGVRRVRYQGVSREVVDEVVPLLAEHWRET